MADWRSRQVGAERVPAVRLIGGLHEDNWRGHGLRQMQAMERVLERVGSVSPVIVSKRSGRVIDGEMRIRMSAKAGLDVDVHWVDLDEGEERVALATFDAIAEMAETDEERLHAALMELTSSSRNGMGESVEGMVEAAADGSILTRLWMDTEQEEEEGLATDDWDVVWVRALADADDARVIDVLTELQSVYDVRVEGRGFEWFS